MIDKPSEKEEEYFKQKEVELLKKFEKEREARLKAEEIEHAKKLHYCKCPKCYGDLKEITFKKKVKIDKCQQCGGVWLDNGELEALAGHEESFLTSFLAHLTGRS
jgi:predicted SprT family Zn-dependent metalloprotease